MLTDAEKFAAPTRRVLFALEVIDSVSGATLTDRLIVEPLDAAGRVINGAPLVSHSGRFVWLEPKNAWPTSVRVRPDDRPNPPPFFDTVIRTPRPDPPIRPAQRLFSALMRPRPGYPFGEGATAVRGMLTTAAGAPIAGALVQLAYKPEGAVNWLPPEPGPDAEPKPGEALTDAAGQFAVFMRLPADVARSAVNSGKLNVRLQVRRAGAPFWTGWVGTDASQLIPAGRPYDKDLTFVLN